MGSVHAKMRRPGKVKVGFGSSYVLFFLRTLLSCKINTMYSTYICQNETLPFQNLKDRLMGVVTLTDPSLIEVAIGEAKYEHVFR